MLSAQGHFEPLIHTQVSLTTQHSLYHCDIKHKVSGDKLHVLYLFNWSYAQFWKLDRNISTFSLPSIRPEAERFTDKMLKFHSHEESENANYMVPDRSSCLTRNNFNLHISTFLLLKNNSNIFYKFNFRTKLKRKCWFHQLKVLIEDLLKLYQSPWTSQYFGFISSHWFQSFWAWGYRRSSLHTHSGYHVLNMSQLHVCAIKEQRQCVRLQSPSCFHLRNSFQCWSCLISDACRSATGSSTTAD